MILAISRLRIPDGSPPARDPLAQRPGAADRKPGCLGLEIYGDASDPALFYMVTRWTDEDAYRAWRASPCHDASPESLPAGIRLEEAATEPIVMRRVADSALPAPAARGDAAVLSDLMRINNEMAGLMRERARREGELKQALDELQQQREALEQANRRIAEMARTDPLTGVFNRRHLDAAIASELERAHRQRSPLTAAILDIDRFKAVNDLHGHAAGDAVLAAVAQALAAHSRPYDTVARYGGEEFVVLLPGTGLAAGAESGERLRAAIASLHVDGYPGRVTASVGVAAAMPGEDAQALLRRADAALYRAKEKGRNLVETDPPGAAALPGAVQPISEEGYT